MLYLSGYMGGGEMLFTTKLLRSQSVIEYTLLFAVTVSALVACVFLSQSREGFSRDFKSMVNNMTQNTVEWQGE